MDTRKLDNGEEIKRVSAPIGTGNIYYVPAGDEGMVQIFDTSLVPPDLIAAALAWELDVPPQEYKKPVYKMKKPRPPPKPYSPLRFKFNKN